MKFLLLALLVTANVQSAELLGTTTLAGRPSNVRLNDIKIVQTKGTEALEVRVTGIRRFRDNASYSHGSVIVPVEILSGADYDAVVSSRHVLGINPFNSQYRARQAVMNRLFKVESRRGEVSVYLK